MSIHEPAQFTPAQVLDAGRRAEAEGRAEYAQQFYRHLADHYPGSPEAAAAEGALARLGAGGPNVMTGMNGHRPPPPMAQPHGYAATSPPSLANPFDPPHGAEPGYQQWPSAAPPYAPSGSSERRDRPEPIELPRPRRDYRTGRLLARIVTWLGGLEVLMGLALIPVALFSPRTAASLPLLGGWLAAPMIAGLSLAIAGTLQVLLGQVVRAVLDQANASRDLAAIARAEAEGRHGLPGRSRRR